MPSRKRGRKARKPPTDPQPSSSMGPTAIVLAEADGEALSQEVVSAQTEFGQLNLQARLNVTQAQVVVKDIGRKGHNFEDPVVKDNARAHFGDVNNVFNFSQPSANKPVDSDESAKLMYALSFDGMSDRLMSVTPAYAETCSWIFKHPEYLRWRDLGQSSSNHGVLWIKGKAGTGKSTLMSCVYEHEVQHDSKGIVVAFFFNARSVDKLVKSTEGMYRSILHQTLDRLPRLKAKLSRIRIPRPEEESWSLEQLENAFRITVLSLSKDEKMTCFIDALDECKTEDVRRAIERFEDLVESAASRNIQFHICFSSRYYPNITMRHQEELRLDVQPEHMRDISWYISQKLTVPETVKLELSSSIYHGCAGIFLWVVLVVKQLREKSDSGSTRTELLATLDLIPRELEELFARVVAKPDNALVAIVQWKLLSKDHLDLRELYFAVQTSIGGNTTAYWDSEEIDNEGMARYILHASRGLVARQAKSSLRPYASFIHESVREYFLCGGLASLNENLQDGEKIASHAQIAKTCLSYIRLVADLPDFTKLCATHSPEIYQHVNTYLPLMRYACRNVLRHAEVAFASGEIDLGILEKFPLQQTTMILDITTGLPALDYEHPFSLLYLLLDQDCTELARALQARTSQVFQSRTPTRYNKADASHTQTSLVKPELREVRGMLRVGPLYVAVVRGRVDLIKLLLDHGADVNTDGSWGNSPLFSAVLANRHDIVHILLRHGARVDIPENKNILHVAANTAKKEIVQSLLEHGVDVNGRNDESQTALHLARLNTNPDGVTEALLKAGADIEATDRSGNTVLIQAAGSWQTRLVQVLLEQGANVYARNNSSGTALHAAVDYCLSRNIWDEKWPVHEIHPMLQALLDTGADINAQDGDDSTVLHSACLEGSLQLVKFLLDRGAVHTPQGKQHDDWVAEIVSKASQPSE